MSTETQEIRKVCRVGTVPIGRSNCSVYLKIEYTDGKLSITGVEGPLPSGNARGSCGQIDMHLRAEDFATFAPGWNTATINKLLAIWGRWHLNDLTPGTPRQMEAIRAKQQEANRADPLHKEAPHAYASRQGFSSYYDMERKWLVEAGLLVDHGYTFGTKWLTEAVPDDVLEFLASLPDADREPAWV